MTSDYNDEFQTVDLIVNSTARSRAVDAFALSLIKAERQIRKLVTHLVYQFPCFGPGDIPITYACSMSDLSEQSQGLF